MAGSVGYPPGVPDSTPERLSRRPLRSAGVALALGLSLVLAACGGDPAADPTTDPSAAGQSSDPSAAATPAGEITTDDNLDRIEITGDDAPTVTVPAPWGISETTVEVLKPGSGPVVAENSWVRVNYHGVNGRTGEVFDSSWERGAPAPMSTDQVVTGFKKALEGQQVGSRVVVAMTGADGYDPQGQPPDILPGDTLIFVIDILGAEIPEPTGTEHAPAPWMPAVTVGDNGVPVITKPEGPAPTETMSGYLIEGDGEVVQEGDAIILRYTAIAWESGTVMEQNFDAPEPDAALLTDLVPGFQEAMIGKKSGSRIVIAIPPSAGYPEGNPELNLAPGETMIYVVDLSFVTPVG
ncbi:peptidylprolyl isomerase [Parenemella sanctibonifatiensis]|uniref:peptidylprolyl isomerase n=1 Tax=Parenemella sanctibonifatiensis TaxID=2016505 RepID=A0A255EIE5_9ACTN|nr:peptidylprolyl isomerase [Parenemella sanctibonifatiensis]